MLKFPESIAFGRRIPKQKFYENLDVSPEIRRLFVSQIRRVVWENKLSVQTMNISPGQEVEEIEVFRILLSGEELDDRVLHLMDRQIPYHLLFLLERPDGSCRLSVAYKEAGGGKSAFRLAESYHTEWSRLEDLALDLTAFDMDALYESIVQQIAGDAIAAPEAESLKEAVEKKKKKKKLQRRVAQLRSRMKKEKQLPKQMELRREIQKLEKELR